MSCLFCSIVAGEVPAQEVYRDDRVVAFLDIAPVFPGHVLVVPSLHADTLVEVELTNLYPVMEVARLLARAVEDPEGLAADGSFVAVNNRVSQSVPHLHVHVVPRRRKDGLRGFFWPRTRYSDETHAAEVAGQIRSSLDRLASSG